MNSDMKLRLSGFVLAIGFLVSLIVWAVLTSSRRVEESRAQLTDAQSKSVRIASDFQHALLALNERVLKFVLHHDTNEWAGFEREWDARNRWIDEQHPPSPREKQVLDRIDAAYDDYHDAARDIERKVTSGMAASVPIVEFARVQNEAARLSDLSFELAEAHRKTLLASLADSRQALAHLRALLLGALFVLVAFGVWLAVVVYRQLIAPLQVKLVESQALLARQEKLASLGVVAAGVAHEIRNPLTAIKAWLFMRRKNLQPGTQEHADAEVISGEIDRLERIVKNFLLFARPADPELKTIPAEQALREVRELLGPHLEKADIRLTLEPPPAALIKVDPQQIKQVLINLVQNAADAIGQNGAVTLRVRSDRKRLAERETDVVILEVADTGNGIPPEVEKRLFDPFFTTKESGTGLGLSIAARIIEKHGGALQYQTRVNHGTTFGIVLRRVENHEVPNSAH